MTEQTNTISTPSDAVAAEIRAELARRGMSLRALAEACDRPPMWVLRRVGPSRSIDVTLEDLAVIAAGLDVQLDALLTVLVPTP